MYNTTNSPTQILTVSTPAAAVAPTPGTGPTTPTTGVANAQATGPTTKAPLLQLGQPVAPQGQPQQQRTLQLGLPIANAGVSKIVLANTVVTLDGTASHSPNNGAIIVAYQWTQLPVGVPVVLSGTNTPTPTFTAPLVHTNTLLGFSLRVIDNHGAVSTNPAIVYIMMKHIITNVPSIAGGIDTQQQQQQSIHPLAKNTPNYPFPPNTFSFP